MSPSAERLVLQSVSPNNGSADIGTAVTIKGAGIQRGAKVMFGKTAATDIAVAANGKSLTCKTPAGTGSVDVSVKNPDGASAKLRKAYRYTPVVHGINTPSTPE